MNLPIDIIPGTDPPRFEWQQFIDSANSREVIPMEGMMPASVEQSMVKLVKMTKELLRENALLQGQVQALNNRLDVVDSAAPAPTPAPVAKSPALYPKKSK